MPLNLYSHRNFIPPARIQESFNNDSWSQITDLIKLFIKANYFCDEFRGFSNSFSYDRNHYFYLYVKSNTNIDLADEFILGFKDTIDKIDTIDILDLIELLYCILYEEKGIKNLYIQDINKIFNKYGLIYEIGSDGKISKKLPVELVDQINLSNSFEFNDMELSKIISHACSKFKSHIFEERKTSLEKIWDAFERIKTQTDSNKKKSISKLINLSDLSDLLKENIENEMITLTKIGNTFQIRHSETDKIPITQHSEIDYLFHRCLSLINLLATNLVRIESSQN